MKYITGISQWLMGLFLAIGIAMGGYFVSQILLNANQDTAEAKGLSERRVDATLLRVCSKCAQIMIYVCPRNTQFLQ
jgi:hypothetical protein